MGPLLLRAELNEASGSHRGEWVEFLGIVKGPTGRTDDFCAAVVPVLTG